MPPKRLRASDIVDEGVAGVHLLCLLAVAGLDPLHRPAEFAALAKLPGELTMIQWFAIA